MRRLLLAIVGVLLLYTSGFAQSKGKPIIDMHFHTSYYLTYGNAPTAVCAPLINFPTHDPATDYALEWDRWLQEPDCKNPSWTAKSQEELKQRSLDILEEFNVIAYGNGPESILREWVEASPDRIIPSLWYSHYLGSVPSPTQIETWFKEGKYKVFGEVAIQYDGVSPSAEAFEPYLAMLERNDIPMGIHIGPGPAGEHYINKTGYRAKLHSALNIEEALVKHPKLRVYIMHAGWPMLDDMIAVMYAHPQVYVEIGLLNYLMPRKEFHHYLKRIVEAGFGKRVMFGTDYIIWPDTYKIAVEAVESADFLSEEQKRDIFYNNAARFLRLPKEIIEKHHKM